MLSPSELRRIAIVLVRARNPNNIGAVARAMHDFGFSDLRIVNEYPMPLEGARSAIDASSVLHAATTYATVAGAVAGCSLVAGTTAVGERVLEHPLHSLSDAAPKLLEALTPTPAAGPDLGQALASPATEVIRAEADSAPRIAILFGSEKTGLSNDELSHCNFLLTIPMHQHGDVRHLSMNLGQAVAVCLYELVRDRPLVQPSNRPEPASAAEQERLLILFTEVLDATGYLRHHPQRSAPADLRRLLLRMNLSRIDAPVWMGILRQMLWKLRN